MKLRHFSLPFPHYPAPRHTLTVRLQLKVLESETGLLARRVIYFRLS